MALGLHEDAPMVGHLLEVQHETRTLVDLLLAEQRSLTAVEQFSRFHEQKASAAQAARYRELMPARAPGSGEQYAFEVDLDRCSGCKACVTACHSLNGLEEAETWRGVGLIIGSERGDPSSSGAPLSPAVVQHVTTACHHCQDPGCLHGCPVLAYDKDPATGIVRHLDDQCIGCQYCVMKCPYEVPRYSTELGIVRKCDMCGSRLAVGIAPACVQACPNEAIKISLIHKDTQGDDGVMESWRDPLSASAAPSPHESGHRLPVFPNPSITRPTTRFLTQRSELARAHAADATELHPAPAHPPLSLMLVLTQFGVGTSGAAAALDPRSALLAWLALGLTLIGVIAATFHLGQPLKAWRSFLGWRRSWLSRELMMFGAVIGTLSLHAWLLTPVSAWIALLTGLVAILCSAMIYVDTQRAFWQRRLTFAKFGLSAALLGGGSAWICGLITRDDTAATGGALVFMASTLAKLGVEIGFVVRYGLGVCRKDQWSPEAAVLRKSALLQIETFRPRFVLRVALGVVGGGIIPGLILTGLDTFALSLSSAAVGLCLVGEVIERHFFFVCEAAPRMPGGVTR